MQNFREIVKKLEDQDLQNTNPFPEKEVKVEWNFQSLKVYYDGRQIDYGLQKLNEHGLITYEGETLFTRNPQCFEFDRKYILREYCKELASTMNRMNTSILYAKNKKNKIGNSNFQNCLRLIDKIPLQIQAFKEVFMFLSYANLQIMLKNDEVFMKIFGIVYELIFLKKLPIETEESIILRTEKQKKCYERLIILIDVLPNEMDLFEFFCKINEKLVRNYLVEENIEYRVIYEDQTFQQKLDYLIKIIKSIHRLLPATENVCNLIQQEVFSKSVLSYINCEVKIITQRQQILMFLEFFQIIIQFDKECAIAVFKDNQTYYQIIFLSYLSEHNKSYPQAGNKFSKNENNGHFNNFQIEEFYILVQKISFFSEFNELSKKVVDYIFEVTPYLTSQQVKIIHKVCLRVEISNERLTQVIESIHSNLKVIKSDFHKRSIKKYKFMIIETVHYVSFLFSKQFNFTQEFILNLRFLVKKCGQSNEGLWKDLKRKLQIQARRKQEEKGKVEYERKILQMLQKS